MGQFSYICKKSNKPIHLGDACHMFLLIDGNVVEYMFGNYDSYGRVVGVQWNYNWDKAVDLHFSDDKKNGFAAILAPFWKEGDKPPKTRSKDDPHQGWGRRRKELKFNGRDIDDWVSPVHKYIK